jgi:urease accessory protein
VLFPRPATGAPFEAVIVTTSGGIVGGDRIAIDIEAGAGSAATLTTQAAEKIYRSTGPDSRIDIDIRVAAGAVLEWMPQETILFDGARLRRTTRIDVSPGARCLAGEFVVFGRRARGETFTRGFLHDGWRIVEDGRPVWADALHLADDIATTMVRADAFGGAAAMGPMVYHADDATDHLDAARDLLSNAAGDRCRAAASCLGRLMIVRFLGDDAAALRTACARFWSSFRAAVLDLPASLPKVWNT